MSALIMECWYRFVWAHHTLRVHSYLLQNATDNDVPSPLSSLSSLSRILFSSLSFFSLLFISRSSLPPVSVITNNKTTHHQMKPSLFDSDQVFNLDNLGEGEESDMEDDGTVPPRPSPPSVY